MKNKIDNYPSPLNYSGFLLWQAANNFEKRVNTALKPYDLNQAEMLHLISIFHLLQTKDSLTQAQLAGFTGVTTMSVSKIITKLEKRLFIERNTGSDPRSKEISITQKGFEILMRCAQVMNELNDSFFPVKSRPQFIDYLSQLS
jgi:DNA-binding MarR family transcriptional regulator